MKTKILIFVLCITVINFTSCSTSNDEVLPDNDTSQVPIEDSYFNYTIGDGPFVYFEDTNFKEILLNDFNINLNRDNEINFEEALAFNGFIDIFNKGITSLIGIEKFENITGLNCARNQISVIDVSNNIKLEFLECGVNPFSDISLEKNVALKRLDIRTTHIVALDLSYNVNLERLIAICSSNLIIVNINNANNSNMYLCNLRHSNPVLECVQVDDIDVALTASNWTKPDDAIYSLTCYDDAQL